MGRWGRLNGSLDGSAPERALAQVGQDQLDRAARAPEDDGLDVVSQQVLRQAHALLQRAAADAQFGVHHRRVVDKERAWAARCPVLVDQRYRRGDQALRQLLRIGDGSRGQDELRLRAVEMGDALQAAQHVGDVRAEHTPVDVRLVDDHKTQVVEEFDPAGVVRQQTDVQHIRVAEQQAGLAAHRRAGVGGRIAVVDAQRRSGKPRFGRAERMQQAAQSSCLVLRQRFGRKKVERPGLGVAQQAVEHRQVVAQRLTAGGAGDDHDILPGLSFFQAVGLVGVQAVDTLRAQRLDQRRMQRNRENPPFAPGEPGSPAALAGWRRSRGRIAS